MGPRSAGASPGPAAYGRGGEEPTCTDADLVLGYIDPDYFLGGRMRLSHELARRAVEQRIAGPLGVDAVTAAAAMAEVIDLTMADGTKNVSLERGYDPRELPLVVAGGAGRYTRARSRTSSRSRPCSCPGSRPCCARSGCCSPTCGTT